MAYEFDSTATPTSATATSIVFAANLSGYSIELVGTGLSWTDATDTLAATTLTQVRVLNGATVVQTITLDTTITTSARVTAFNAAASTSTSAKIAAILNGATDAITFAVSDTSAIDGGTGATDVADFSALSTAVTANISSGLVSGGAGSRTMTGIEVLIGSAASTADTLTGDSNANTLDGGVDSVRDNLIGGDGDDTYVLRDASGSAVDAIIDSAGTDTITTTIDRDLTDFLADIEKVTLLTGASAAYGNALNNTLTGNAAANILDGRDGSDTLVGDAGDDTYYVRNYTDSNTAVAHTDTITETSGNGTDTVIAASSYTLASGVSVEVLQTTSSTGVGNFNLTGNELAQSITGNAGNNVLDGGSAGDDGVFDELTGGAGNDTYVLGGDASATLDSVTEAAGGGTDTIKSSITRDLADFANVENITLTGTGAADATGNASTNVLYGNDGANVLNGKGGKDYLKGFGGADTFVFDGSGQDVAQDFTAADDKVDLATVNISEFATIQAIAVASGASDTILRSLTNNAVNSLTLKGLAKSAMVTGLFTYATSTAADTFTGTAGNDYGFGGLGGDTLNGGAGTDTLFGEGGDDTIDGGTGNDFMYGSSGNDTYVVDSLTDQIFDGTGLGTDTVRTKVSIALPTVSGTKQIENLQIFNAADTASINLTGNSLANTITGSAGNNIINGGTGADTMIGLGGNDVYYVDNASDAITETSTGGSGDKAYTTVSYTLDTGVYVETLAANGGGTISLTGNEIAQAIVGGAGANTINGKAGNDTLTGGLGNDTFVFDTALASNKDTIKDFNAAADTINLENAIFTALSTTGTLAAAAFYQGTAAHDADDRIVYNRVTGEVSYDADGTGATAAVVFAVISNKVAMTNADFVVV